jgi:hypothetical protein
MICTFFIFFFHPGDSAVGKTCFLHQYIEKEFKPSFASTVGVDFQEKRLVHIHVDYYSLSLCRGPICTAFWETKVSPHLLIHSGKLFHPSYFTLKYYEVIISSFIFAHLGLG